MAGKGKSFDKLFLKACIDSPVDMIVFAIDKKYNYLTFNTYHEKVMKAAYGIEIKQGMNLIKCMTNEDDIRKTKINFGRAFEGESHITVEEYGEIEHQYYETRYNPIYNEDNQILGATAFSSNVTENKKNEEIDKDTRRFLLESQSVARLGTFKWDMSDGLWKSSKILDEIFGIDDKYQRTLAGWGRLIHPKWKKIMLNYVEHDILGKHLKFDKEYEIIRQSDKQIRWVHGLAELELDNEGNPLRLIGTISDITNRKIAEEKLKEQSKALKKELAAKKKTEIFLQKSHKKLEISRRASLNLLEDIKLEVDQRKKAEEEVRKINLMLEQRVAERTKQLESANKELEAFAYSVSHDLRAPLRAIDGFSKFLLNELGGKLDNEGIRLLGLIRSNTQKMDQLIIDILALSRVSRNSLKKSKIDMVKMSLSMLNEVATSEIQKGIKFIIGDMPEANADSTYIKQVWINLISNAIKFSSKKASPEIEFGGYKDDGVNIYFVRDNGIGFKSEYAHKLFAVFQRLHKPSDFEGNGVGLAIVQRIINRHNGEVWAEGKPDKGATFYFSLPLVNS